MINEKDPNCICYGNWQSIVKENQDNLDKIYIDEDGKEFIFFGIVYGSDDYYYGLHERGTIGKLRLVSCVMNIESAGFTLKENKMKDGIDVDKMLNLDEETVKIPADEALEMFPNAKNFFYWFPRQADYTNTNSYTDMTWNKWAYPVTTNFVRGSY
mgnify:CR=1 FL=1